ncbi:hypothetical protein Cni_G06654 [Canna indica]|uniref:Uncharacterized protein n=1 Tax=Canna indica TaxID=4628 RepID=A0AAQ3K0N1_9LILI|nr:hypothetical protein Cni_G06654 [Canna indica]
MGDFNCIECQEDKTGEKNINFGSAMKTFKELKFEAGLIDLDFTGYKFTWCNNRHEDKRIMARLDRMYANGMWLSKYSSAIVYHLKRLASDHRPIMLDSRCNINPQNRERRSIFELYWLESEDIAQLIKENWGKNVNQREKIEYFMNCLGSLGKDLRLWSKNCFGSLEKRLKDTLVELEALETADEQGLATDAEIGNIQCLTNKAMTLNKQLHIKWWTKARTRWIEMNDKNTKYFHNRSKFKRKKNTITLITENGKDLSETSHIIQAFERWYMDLWKEDSIDQNLASWDDLKLLKWRKVPNDSHTSLTRMFFEQEVVDAMNSLGKGKAPGPDGYSLEFYLNF